MTTRDEIAFRAGREAHRKGEHWGANPHAIVEPREIELHLDWCDGWHEEQIRLADLEKTNRAISARKIIV